MIFSFSFFYIEQTFPDLLDVHNVYLPQVLNFISQIVAFAFMLSFVTIKFKK